MSVAKRASKKIGALISSMKFLSPDFVLYLYKSTIQPHMEYCCDVWAGAPRCYLELLDKLQNWMCRTVGPSLVIIPRCYKDGYVNSFFLAQLDSGFSC